MPSDDPLPGSYLEGRMLLVDKPKSWTSFDVVNKIRYRLKNLLNIKKIKVGHAGTLDPLATGLLIICTGKATKNIQTFQGLPKDYEGTIILGATTPSYDGETEIDATFPFEHITLEDVKEATKSLTGEIDQIPPVFSAIKVDGQPLYKKARKGIKVEVRARTVTVFNFEITRFELPEIDFKVHCSKGTYIRSLAHDLGKALNSGAYLASLRRTAIGPYHIDEAWDLEELIERLSPKENEGQD
ncbi:MAG: tRNA pseudouridine(55) synthase TruB [Bacteroidetes bacterium]|nr:tRNA pseudouridine(55) synthase TruB [Bacteroidota bacterium]